MTQEAAETVREALDNVLSANHHAAGVAALDTLVSTIERLEAELEHERLAAMLRMSERGSLIATIEDREQQRDEARVERDQLVAFLIDTATAVENPLASREEIAMLLRRAYERFQPERAI